ncbi:hypothetical protein RHGRI_016666 [Rhododendron griersonianum]|uniref:Protein kinase domain-containing protein n=1 Tax=Rhododendron griersonianum TaxID=479676 RepID=A0AAV6JV49_9ERIC|nr:hypothetical protein RHGRI_016666 [Rhododendron griersonianum]
MPCRLAEIEENNFDQFFCEEENEQGIFDAVIQGNLDFASDPWPSISNSAKDLVKKMLQSDPKERLSTTEVLNYPWIREDGDASDKPIDIAVLSRMKQLRAMNKLKKVALKNEEHSCKGPSENQIKLHSDQVKADCYGKFQAEESDEAACMPSNSDLHERGQSNLMDTIPRAGNSSSQAFSSRSLHPSSRFLSRFNFIPGNVSFRLSRSSSLGSSRQGLDYEDFGSRNLESHPTATGFSESLQCDQNTSGLNVARDISITESNSNFFNLHSPRVIFSLYFGCLDKLGIIIWL